MGSTCFLYFSWQNERAPSCTAFFKLFLFRSFSRFPENGGQQLRIYFLRLLGTFPASEFASVLCFRGLGCQLPVLRLGFSLGNGGLLLGSRGGLLGSCSGGLLRSCESRRILSIGTDYAPTAAIFRLNGLRPLGGSRTVGAADRAVGTGVPALVPGANPNAVRYGGFGGWGFWRGLGNNWSAFLEIVVIKITLLASAAARCQILRRQNPLQHQIDHAGGGGEYCDKHHDRNRDPNAGIALCRSAARKRIVAIVAYNSRTGIMPGTAEALAAPNTLLAGAA